MRSLHRFTNSLNALVRSVRYAYRTRQRWSAQLRNRFGRYGLLSIAVGVLSITLSAPLIAISSSTASPSEAPSYPSMHHLISRGDDLLNHGQSLYETGRYGEAVMVLDEAILNYRNQGNALGEAIAQSNLSLVYQGLGRWQDATAAIENSLSILSRLNNQVVQAQALDIQGELQFSQGQFEQALSTWEQSAELYLHQDNSQEMQAALIRNSVHQAEALQALGLYRRAIAVLNPLTQSIQDEPPSQIQAAALRSLGDALRVIGELNQSNTRLQESLAIAKQIQMSEEQAAIYLSLGNTAYAQRQLDIALDYYQQAAQLTTSDMTRVQADLNHMRVLADRQDWQTLEQRLPPISNTIEHLALNRPAMLARINLARTLIQAINDLNNSDEPEGITDYPAVASWFTLAAHHLVTARQHANEFGDSRVESFALGSLGDLYEAAGQWADAQPLAEEALNLAQQINATDIAYLWQWHLGRVYQKRGERERAIAAYQNAIALLQGLRNDLVAINPEVQFSFRESIEPIHRELVSLLIPKTIEPSQADLEQARRTIESLQLAELDNFFREACLNAREVQIDRLDQKAAVLYPIILEDRLEVIISLPPDPETEANSESRILRHQTNSEASAAAVEAVSSNLLASLKQPSANFRALPLAQDMYRWLIAPFEAELEQRDVRTLVFVLDGVLRNIPMAALYDGDQYLIERYTIALAPSLQLLESDPVPPQQLNVLLGGISEPHQDFVALPGVVDEVGEIQRIVPDSQKLLNHNFTDVALQNAINTAPFPVVHLATHGRFSSSLDETFILTWGDRLNVNELNRLLQTTDVTRRRPIELLVLSACETAEGDDRATLGLAGVAVRAGARSTVATLWQLDDQAAPLVMKRFYQALTTENVTKAEALHRAQLSLLENPQYRLPYFWSPIVLIGNWL